MWFTDAARAVKNERGRAGPGDEAAERFRRFQRFEFDGVGCSGPQRHFAARVPVAAEHLEPRRPAGDFADEERAGVTAVGVEVEPREGGQVLERLSSGERLSWGRVLVWDPPARLVLAWKPNQVLLVLAERQLARRYGLPCYGSLGLTDALPMDFQMGFEKGMSAAISTLSGAFWVGNQGHIGADQAASLEITADRNRCRVEVGAR